MARGTARALGLALVVALAAAAVAAPEARLDPRVRPTAQSIRLEVDPDATDFSGAVRIELAVREATDTFAFHAEELDLRRVALRGNGQAVTVEVREGERGRWIARAGRTLEVGPYSLEIHFSGSFNTRAVGLYRAVVQDRAYLFTQFQPADARKAFPCWDEPSYKIPFQLTVELPEPHMAVSNTAIESESVAEGRRTVEFHRTKPLPTYLLALAVGELEAVPIPGLSVPGRVITVQGQSHLAGLAVETTPPLLAAFEEYFGRSYPFAKLDLIAVPEFWYGAMENAGAVTFAADVLLVDPKAASVGQRRDLALMTAHELAHMWFGNLVTMEWWDDLWLSEAFADWMSDKINRQVFPELRIDVEELMVISDVMADDARPSARAIRRPVTSPEELMEHVDLTYAKGKALLGMVERWLGVVEFRRGVLAYLEARAWGSAVAEDLWEALGRAAGRDVRGPLASFLDQPGFPMLRLEPAPDAVITVRQERFCNFGVELPELRWEVPVAMRYEAESGGGGTRHLLLDAPAAEIRFDEPPLWVMPNLGGVGYYRWVVPPRMLLRIAESAPRALDARERISFLGNAEALLDAGVLSGAEYLGLLAAFAEDPDPLVISAVVSGVAEVERAFVSDSLEDAFAAYVRRTLRPALERFGVRAVAGEEEAVSLLRPRLIAWLGEEGRDEEIRLHARALAAAYLAEPASIDPSLAGVALRLAALDGDRALFVTYRKRFEAAEVPMDRYRFLAALGAFGEPEVREAALDYALEGPVRPTELFTIPFVIGAGSRRGGDRALAWGIANYDEIASRLPPEEAAYLPLLAGGCSLERLRTAEAFFAEHPGVEGTRRQLEKVSDQVKECVDLRRREGAAVRDYLTGGGESGAATDR